MRSTRYVEKDIVEPGVIITKKLGVALSSCS